MLSFSSFFLLKNKIWYNFTDGFFGIAGANVELEFLFVSITQEGARSDEDMERTS